jgi:hypothetical protein
MKIPIQSQPIMRNVATAKTGGGMGGVTASKRWGCYYQNSEFKGDVNVNWSEEQGAGDWACNAWRGGWLGCNGECTAYPLPG